MPRSVVVAGSRIGGHPKSTDVGWWRHDDVSEPVGPAFQRLAFFGLVAVNVVDLVDAFLLMADDQLGDKRRDAERGEIGARGPSQIMETPIGQPGPRIDCVLVEGEAAD